MRHFLFPAAAALAMALSLSSCLENNGVIYGNLTEFAVVETPTRILTDEGVYFNIVENESNRTLDTMKRVVCLCDVLENVSSGEYNIRLKEVLPVTVTRPVLSGTPQADAVEYDDPVYIESAWVAGGFLNLSLGFYVLKGSKTPHTFLLVQEDPVYDEDKGRLIDINFRFYHQGGGESYAREDIELVDLEQVSTYISFPLEELDPYHGGPAEDGSYLRLVRRWHIYEDDAIVRSTQLYTSYGEISKL